MKPSQPNGRDTINSKNRTIIAPYEKPKRKKSKASQQISQPSGSAANESNSRPRTDSGRSVADLTREIDEFSTEVNELGNASSQSIYEYSLNENPSESEPSADAANRQIDMAGQQEEIARMVREQVAAALQAERNQQQQNINQAIEREREQQQQRLDQALQEQQRQHQQEINELRARANQQVPANNQQQANPVQVDLRYNSLTLPSDIEEVPSALSMWELSLPEAVRDSPDAMKKMLIQAMTPWKLLPIFRSKINELQNKSYEQIKELIMNKLKLNDVQILFSPRKNTQLVELYNAATNVVNSNDRERILQYIERHVSSEELLELRKSHSDEHFSDMIRLLSEERVRKQHLQPSSGNQHDLANQVKRLQEKLEALSVNNLNAYTNEQPEDRLDDIVKVASEAAINAIRGRSNFKNQDQQTGDPTVIINGQCGYHRQHGAEARTCVPGCKFLDKSLFRFYDDRTNKYFKSGRPPTRYDNASRGWQSGNREARYRGHDQRRSRSRNRNSSGGRRRSSSRKGRSSSRGRRSSRRRRSPSRSRRSSSRRRRSSDRYRESVLTEKDLKLIEAVTRGAGKPAAMSNINALPANQSHF